MTTICFKAGWLAADRGVFDATAYLGQVSKIHALPDGIIAAGAGDLCNVARFVEWVRAGCPAEDRPKLEGEFCGVVVKGWEFTRYEESLLGYSYQPHNGFWAIGSGTDVALGALAAGASAEQACEIACLYDKQSAGPVETFRVSSRTAAAAAE